jgi:hypothetical protein
MAFSVFDQSTRIPGFYSLVFAPSFLLAFGQIPIMLSGAVFIFTAGSPDHFPNRVVRCQSLFRRNLAYLEHISL